MSITDGLDVLGLIALAVGAACLVASAAGLGLGIVVGSLIILGGSQLIAHLQAPRPAKKREDDQ